MALTQTDLDNLEAAMVSSELEVELEGRRVRYRSLAELKGAYQIAKDIINAQAAGGAARQTGSFRFQYTTSRD